MSWAQVGRAGLSGKNPRLVCSSDFASTELAGLKFDWIYSFSVLYHLSDEILDAYFEMVAGRLTENGQCIANVNTTIPSDKWLQFPFLMRSIEAYEAMAAKYGLVTTALGTLRENGFRNPGMESHNPILRFQLKNS
jgi:cyclopropane fatty-acyl-phospholipid synthase-like methyltransferase